jgi:hypothetical protein
MSWLRRPGASGAQSSLEIPEVPDGVVQVCHPDWRGVRSSAIAFRDPVLEANDLNDPTEHIDDLIAAGVTTVVIQGWPPNAEAFATAASGAGLSVLGVFHSSPAQHGADGGEAEAVHQMFELQGSGVMGGVATVKAGLVESFESLGYDIQHVGNRVPVLGKIEPVAVKEGTNVGILLFPMWRKNVTTQVLAAHELGWRPFVMADPQVPYLSPHDLTICGELPRDEFLSILAAMNISFNVTLSECHPMMPMESYRLGVPSLISSTSDLFTDDPRLNELTTVRQPDNPSAIARAASQLLEHRDEAVSLANASLDRTDRRSAEQWRVFTRGQNHDTTAVHHTLP